VRITRGMATFPLRKKKPIKVGIFPPPK